MPEVNAVTPPSSPRGYNKEIVEVTASTTLDANYRDRLIRVNSGSSVTLTLPNDLPVGFHFEWERYGSGALIFAAASGATLNSENSSDRAKAQYSKGTVHVTAQAVNGIGAVYNLAGDVTDSTGETTATVAELNYLDIATLGTGAASKAVVLDAGEDYTWPATGVLTYGVLKDPAATTITSTGAEINLLDGSSTANSTASKAAILDGSKLLQTNANNGTVEAGVTAVHYGDGVNVTAVLTLTNVALTVGNSENLAVGALLYTLPAGACLIRDAYMSVGISGVTTTTDTPDVGLGTVIGSGVVTTLDGTATFEDIITGQTAADTNGTATVKGTSLTAGASLEITTGGAHTVHFNAADGWGANADASGLLNGTVVLSYIRQAA